MIRVSGNLASEIATALIGKLPKPRYATLAVFTGAEGVAIDEGIALYFPGPSSFTGEDVLELQGHGGPVVLDMLLARVIGLGARLALPGEFSERAFLNDKIDLSQAEAIADLIDSVSQQAAKGAMRSLQGEFSIRVTDLSEMMINLRMYIEAAIDFPEEEVDFLADDKVLEMLALIETTLRDIIQQAGEGALLREGLNLVIAGRPNAGKSSLMNRLTGKDASIVTEIPGTTRDIVNEYIHLDGIPLKLIDTAGIRKSEDAIEVEGVRRAIREVEQADQVLAVVDFAAHPDDWAQEAERLVAEIGVDRPVTIVLNKMDLATRAPSLAETGEVQCISALTGAGMEDLKAHIKVLAGFQASGEGQFMARRRHVDALARASERVQEGRRQLEHYRAGELLAEELKLAHECLCEITGQFTSDDLLGKIFSSFCIGK